MSLVSNGIRVEGAKAFFWPQKYPVNGDETVIELRGEFRSSGKKIL